MPFIELNQRLHPLQNGDNLLGSGGEADLHVAELGAGDQVTIRVERVGTLAWATGGAQLRLNGEPVSDPVALRDGDRLALNGATVIYRERASRSSFESLGVAEGATIPMGATVPMKIDRRRVANGGFVTGGVAPPGPQLEGEPSAIRDGRVVGPVGSAGRSAGRGQGPPGGSPDAGRARSVEPPPVLEPEEPQVVAVVKNKKDGASYVIEKSGFRIGREKRSDLVIPQPSVSRLHAEIAFVRGGYLLRDLGRTGTLVNGKKVTEPCRLKVGDTIQIGDTELVFAKRPATAEDLVHPNDVTPIFSSVEDAPTMVALRKGGSSWFTWLLLLIAGAAAAAIYLI